MKKIIILWAALLVAGCSQETGELLQTEQDTMNQEEVQKASEETKEEKVASSAQASNQGAQLQSAGEQFDALPAETQIALLTPYFDERGKPENIDGYLYINYGRGDNYALIQVHSGVGSGHPVYKIERHGDSFEAIDGVVYMGRGDQYEAVNLPSVQVTVEELMADYENAPGLYDQAAEDTHLNTEYLNLVTFEQQKSMIGQSQPDQDSSETEEIPAYEEEPPYESEEDLAYDGDLGDADLFPNQPMFIDGVLHSGDTSGVPSEMIITAEDLRSGGYTVYELSDEDYDRLMQDINNSVITYEEALSHYLNNY